MPDLDRPPIIVAGMGPGGLCAAIETARKGYPVIIVEPRDYFTRVQRVHIDKATLSYLESMREKDDPQDNKFFEHQLNEMESSVQVKDVQAFLLRKVKAYPNVKIRQGKGHRITQLDPNSQSVTLVDPSGHSEEIGFSHFIAADGASHPAANLLNDHLTSEQKISYKPMSVQPRHEATGAISLQAKPGVKFAQVPVHSRPFSTEHIPKLLDLGWNEAYFPNARVFRNAENTKFFISGEVPKMIQHIKSKSDQQAALERWGKYLLQVQLGLSEDQLEIAVKKNSANPQRRKEKEALQATAFSLRLLTADKPCVELSKGGAFVLVGDAFKNANFFYAHGMNDAILDGRKCAENITGEPPSFNFKTYQSHQANQMKNFDMKLRWGADSEDMPGTKEKLMHSVTRLFKLAEKSSDPRIKRRVNDLKGQAQPDAADFDPILYQSRVADLLKLMTEAAEPSTAKSSGRLMFRSDMDKNKKNMQLEEVQQELKSAFNRYFTYNQQHRQSTMDSIREAFQSVKSKKNN